MGSRSWQLLGPFAETANEIRVKPIVLLRYSKNVDAAVFGRRLAKVGILTGTNLRWQFAARFTLTAYYYLRFLRGTIP